MELFFKWIKQNLKIKLFVGTSKNAVVTQIWIALCIYLLLSFVKFQSKLKKSMQQILRLLQLNLLSQTVGKTYAVSCKALDLSFRSISKKHIKKSSFPSVSTGTKSARSGFTHHIPVIRPSGHHNIDMSSYESIT